MGVSAAVPRAPKDRLHVADGRSAAIEGGDVFPSRSSAAQPTRHPGQEKEAADCPDQRAGEFVPAQELPCHFPQAHLGIQMQARLEKPVTRRTRQLSSNAATKTGKLFLSNRQASRHLMSAKFFQQIAALAEARRPATSPSMLRPLPLPRPCSSKPMMIVGR